MSERRGLVEVYTGDGKGKTTAAMGLALRAAGYKLRTLVVQFVKSQECGEHLAAGLLGHSLEIVRAGAGFVLPGADLREHREAACRALSLARDALASGRYDIIILDEINCAASLGLVRADEILELIRRRPPAVELVLTGRGAPAAVLEAADLVTVMQEVKHPYRSGGGARIGIDY